MTIYVINSISIHRSIRSIPIDNLHAERGFKHCIKFPARSERGNMVKSDFKVMHYQSLILGLELHQCFSGLV